MALDEPAHRDASHEYQYGVHARSVAVRHLALNAGEIINGPLIVRNGSVKPLPPTHKGCVKQAA